MRQGEIRIRHMDTEWAQKVHDWLSDRMAMDAFAQAMAELGEKANRGGSQILRAVARGQGLETSCVTGPDGMTRVVVRRPR
jgi:hypothetical protein